MITGVPFLEGQPLKFGRAIKRLNFGAIFENFRLDREYLQNGSTYRTSEKKLDQPQPLPRWRKEIW